MASFLTAPIVDSTRALSQVSPMVPLDFVGGRRPPGTCSHSRPRGNHRHCSSTLLALPATEGTGEHCSYGGCSTLHQHMYDRLDEAAERQRRIPW
ncbi:hypothetical protein CIK77_04205 [Microbacterium sp. JB110]|nr:hypothetical protein CIK77_04205 [Microbacterium sp. JB110]